MKIRLRPHLPSFLACEIIFYGSLALKILPYASKECDRHDLDVRKYACARAYLPFSPTKQFYGGRDYYNVTISKIVGDGAFDVPRTPPVAYRDSPLKEGANGRFTNRP